MNNVVATILTVAQLTDGFREIKLRYGTKR